MKKLIPMLALAILLLGAATILAQSGSGYDLGWWSVDGGGGTVSGGGYTLTGVIGQPDAGSALSGGGYTLSGGYWGGSSTEPTLNRKTYLPLISK